MFKDEVPEVAGMSGFFVLACDGDADAAGELATIGGGTEVFLFEAVAVPAVERPVPSRRAACNSLS
jgi:hypothetical protein